MLGNSLTEQRCFNSLLQPVVIRQRTGSTLACQGSGLSADLNDVGYLSYGFSASANNGNVASQTVQYAASGSLGAKTFTQAYTYAGPNRLTGMSEIGPGAPWSQTFGYDNVGNRWITTGQIDPLSPTSNGFDGNNHMSTWTYGDNRGNVTHIGGYDYQYDAENRLVTATLSSNGTVYNSAAYTYDGDGRRVIKQTGGVTTHYVYDVQGQLAAEYTIAGSASGLTSGTSYVMADHLGSTRMLTDASHNQLALFDYAPFGEQLTAQDGRDTRWGGPNSGLRFTGQQRDVETTLDYFGARYFSGAQGRFTSPDEPLTDQVPSDPQSWNLYGYARNNPLKFTDLTGQDCVYANSGDGTVGLERGDSCSQKGGTFINGTIDANSFTYDSKTNSIGYTYSNTAEGTGGAGSIGLRNTPTLGEAFIAEMGRRSDASNQFIGEFAKQAAIGATLGVAGRLIGAGIEAALAARAASAAVGAQGAAVGLGVTGTRAAATVAERLAIEAAQSNPAVGKVLQTKLNDPRWPMSQGWVKMESRSPGGVVVHWVRNTITGAVADFKLK